MSGGLRYQTGREMPPGMQELYAVQEVAKMIADGQVTKEEGREKITPQSPAATAPLQGSQGEWIAAPVCALARNDGVGRGGTMARDGVEYNRALRESWMEVVQAKVYRDIQRSVFTMGLFPVAIIVGGEYQYAFLCDAQGLQLTTDGGRLWRGVPIIACGRHNKVSVVWAMEDIDLPKPPEGGYL